MRILNALLEAMQWAVWLLALPVFLAVECFDRE